MHPAIGQRLRKFVIDSERKWRRLLKKVFKMPCVIGISEFVDETMDDFNSPTTSSFVAKMPQCRQTVSGFEDVSIITIIINHSANLFSNYSNACREVYRLARYKLRNFPPQVFFSPSPRDTPWPSYHICYLPICFIPPKKKSISIKRKTVEWPFKSECSIKFFFYQSCCHYESVWQYHIHVTVHFIRYRMKDHSKPENWYWPLCLYQHTSTYITRTWKGARTNKPPRTFC